MISETLPRSTQKSVINSFICRKVSKTNKNHQNFMKKAIFHLRSKQSVGHGLICILRQKEMFILDILVTT